MPVPVFTAGEVLTAANMNRVGLWLIKTDTITSGSSKEITGLFSNDYRNYLIVVDNFKSSATAILRMRMGTASAGYYAGGAVVLYSSAVVSGETVNNGSEWVCSALSDGSTVAATAINVFNPFANVQTTYTSFGSDNRTGGAGGRSYSGFLNNTTSYSSVTFLLTGATFTNCNIAVYGYRT